MQENYVIGLGIRGYKNWQKRWIRRLKGMKEEELEHLNHSRVMLVEKVDALMYVLKQKQKTVRDITLAVYEFMVKENLQDRLARQEEAFQEAGELALAKEYAPFVRKIEVEVENLDMVCEAVEAGADIIMLDNMDHDTMKEALEIIDGRAQVEVSGNMTAENLEKLSELRHCRALAGCRLR